MKLEDINKENIFKVPERYFDELPGKIQDSIPVKAADTKPVFAWKLATAIVVPAMMILFFLIYNGSPQKVPSDIDVEYMISQVAMEDVISYLELTDLSADDILEQVVFTDIDPDLDQEIPLQLEGLDIEEEGLKIIIEHYDITI